MVLTNHCISTSKASISTQFKSACRWVPSRPSKQLTDAKLSSWIGVSKDKMRKGKMSSSPKLRSLNFMKSLFSRICPMDWCCNWWCISQNNPYQRQKSPDFFHKRQRQHSFLSLAHWQSKVWQAHQTSVGKEVKAIIKKSWDFYLWSERVWDFWDFSRDKCCMVKIYKIFGTVLNHRSVRSFT